MREVLVKADPFDKLQIMELESTQQVNEHGELMFSGLIESEMEKKYLSWALKENPLVSIQVLGENSEQKVFFQGVLIDFEIQVRNDVKYLTGHLRTNTYLMDRIPHIRSFQSPNTQYNDMLSIVGSGYSKYMYIMAKGDGETIPGLVLQYDETDWEFVKRMASHFQTIIIPDVQRDHIAYTFGLPPAGASFEIQTNMYSISKNTGRLISTPDKQYPNADVVFYVLKSREIYRLGDCITLNGLPLRVYSIKTKMEGSELYHTYYLTGEDGFKVIKSFNEDIIGLSLNSRVTSVRRDTVQISIDRDENIAKAGFRDFLYSTIYSTPDGTGWYCMPEVGDAVRIYFPHESETDAYVASSIHLESSAGDERVNPDYKSIMNKQKKEILFTPGTLLLTNNAGMSIELSDSKGITILSDKAIVIKSEDMVDISSATNCLSINAPQSIILQQGDTQMSLQEKLYFGGAQVHLD